MNSNYFETPKIENCSLCGSEVKLYEDSVKALIFIECSNKSCLIRMCREDYGALRLIDAWNVCQRRIASIEKYVNKKIGLRR